MTENDGTQHDQDQITQLTVAISEQLEAGHSKRALIERLARGGIQYQEAVAFVNEIDRMRRTQHRNSGLWNTIIGTILVAVGIAVTVWTYTNAKPGESYYVVWGLVAVGIWRVGLGIYRLTKWKGRSAAQREEDTGRFGV